MTGFEVIKDMHDLNHYVLLKDNYGLTRYGPFDTYEWGVKMQNIMIAVYERGRRDKAAEVRKVIGAKE